LESTKRKIYENRFQWILSIALILLVLEGLIQRDKKMKARIFVIILVLFNLGFGPAVVGKVKQGNKLFQKENYNDALKKYTDAQIDKPESPELFYNIANVLYKQSKYAESEQMFN